MERSGGKTPTGRCFSSPTGGAAPAQASQAWRRERGRRRTRCPGHQGLRWDRRRSATQPRLNTVPMETWRTSAGSPWVNVTASASTPHLTAALRRASSWLRPQTHTSCQTDSHQSELLREQLVASDLHSPPAPPAPQQNHEASPDRLEFDDPTTAAWRRTNHCGANPSVGGGAGGGSPAGTDTRLPDAGQPCPPGPGVEVRDDLQLLLLHSLKPQTCFSLSLDGCPATVTHPPGSPSEPSARSARTTASSGGAPPRHRSG